MFYLFMSEGFWGGGSEMERTCVGKVGWGQRVVPSSQLHGLMRTDLWRMETRSDSRGWADLNRSTEAWISQTAAISGRNCFHAVLLDYLNLRNCFNQTLCANVLLRCHVDDSQLHFVS